MTDNILKKIVAHKKEELAILKRRVPIRRLIDLTDDCPPRRPFFDRLRDFSREKVNIIAEIKRASPSAGVIRPDLDAATQAVKYEAGGAAALSVLTDSHFFNGGLADLKAAKNAGTLPVLRKDFIISSYQLYESAVQGADAVLLIVRILSEHQLTDYLKLAESIGLDTLVEIHAAEDLDIACRAGARLIGINNRDLASFKTDTKKAIGLVNRLGPDQVPLAASGIRNRADIDAGLRAGIGNFLIGETLVRSEDPINCLRKLRGVGA